MGLSYLLIGFWYYKPSAARAAKKAFLTTRIGDLPHVGIMHCSARPTANYHQLFDWRSPKLHQLRVALRHAFLVAIGKALGSRPRLVAGCHGGPTTVSH
jgi:NADH:ubiquinone oxidoreductase subunit 5 (subunit L)/multisubunit Na+/H+ antiporter MnhA subunit